MKPHLIIYSRTYCHLCQEMVDAVQQQFAPALFRLEVLDVDQDEEAQLAYDELVPVLLLQKEDGSREEICHYVLDAAKLAPVLGID